MTKKVNDFETNLLKLQEISQKIGRDDISLEEASKLYEEGMKLSSICQKYIDEKELKIEELSKK